MDKIWFLAIALFFALFCCVYLWTENLRLREKMKKMERKEIGTQKSCRRKRAEVIDIRTKKRVEEPEE